LADGFGAKGGKPDAVLALDHDGKRQALGHAELAAAVPVTAPFGSGYRIAKTITPVEQKVAGKWSRGDVVRCTSPSTSRPTRPGVVVNDPIPGGAALLGTGLGGGDQIATAARRRTSAAGSRLPGAQLRGLPARTTATCPRARSVSTTRCWLNNPGRFNVPQTHVEAMYAPEVFGEAPNAPGRSSHEDARALGLDPRTVVRDARMRARRTAARGAGGAAGFDQVRAAWRSSETGRARSPRRRRAGGAHDLRTRRGAWGRWRRSRRLCGCVDRVRGPALPGALRRRLAGSRRRDDGPRRRGRDTAVAVDDHDAAGRPARPRVRGAARRVAR